MGLNNRKFYNFIRFISPQTFAIPAVWHVTLAIGSFSYFNRSGDRIKAPQQTVLCSRLGVHPAQAMAQMFRSAVAALKIAMAGLRELSIHLADDERVWIQPWLQDCERLARLAETHSAMLSDPSGTSCSSPTWGGSTN
jgi:hypothetical protein